MKKNLKLNKTMAIGLAVALGGSTATTYASNYFNEDLETIEQLTLDNKTAKVKRPALTAGQKVFLEIDANTVYLFEVADLKSNLNDTATELGAIFLGKMTKSAFDSLTDRNDYNEGIDFKALGANDGLINLAYILDPDLEGFNESNLQTFNILQVGKGSELIGDSFTAEELNSLISNVNLIKENAFSGKTITSTGDINLKLNYLQEIEANGFAVTNGSSNSVTIEAFDLDSTKTSADAFGTVANITLKVFRGNQANFETLFNGKSNISVTNTDYIKATNKDKIEFSAKVNEEKTVSVDFETNMKHKFAVDDDITINAPENITISSAKVKNVSDVQGVSPFTFSVELKVTVNTEMKDQEVSLEFLFPEGKVNENYTETVKFNFNVSSTVADVVDNDIINAGDYSFKVLDAANKKVALIGKTTTKAEYNGTLNSTNSEYIDSVTVNGNNYIVTQLGNGTDATSGNITTEDINKFGNTIEKVVENALKDIELDISKVAEIKLNKCTEVKENGLAFTLSDTNKAVKISLEGIINSQNINKNAFNTNTKIELYVKSDIKNEVSNMFSENKNITVLSNTNNLPNNNSGGGSSGGAIINSAGQTQTTVAGQTQTTVEGQTETTTSQLITKNLSLDKVALPTISESVKSFTDIPATHWANEAISRLSSAGIIQGMPNGSFNANGNTKRADMAVILIRLLGINETFSENFSDIEPNAYYANAVGIAREYGIVTGSTDGKFNPNANISRQDTMVMIARILQNLGISVNNDTSTLSQFSDSSNISQYALEATAILVNAGIINGNNGKINPKAPITRAEIAVVMNKLYNIIDENKKIETTTEASTETTTANGSTETTTSNGSTETATSNGSTETTTSNGSTETTTETTTK